MTYRRLWASDQRDVPAWALSWGRGITRMTIGVEARRYHHEWNAELHAGPLALLLERVR